MKLYTSFQLSLVLIFSILTSSERDLHTEREYNTSSEFRTKLKNEMNTELLGKGTVINNELYEYVDSINLFKVKLPIKWDIIKEKNNKGVIAIDNGKTKDVFNANITIIRTPIPSEVGPNLLKEYLLKALNEQYNEFQVIDEAVSENSVSIIYKMKIKNVLLKGVSINYLISNSNYSITAISTENSYPKYQELFTSVGKSLSVVSH